MFRFDYHFSDFTTVFVRYNADDGVTTVPSGNFTAVTKDVNRPSNGVVELLKVFSPTLVNETKFGANRAPYINGVSSPVKLPLTLSVTGASDVLGSTAYPVFATAWSLLDDVTAIHGPHTLKAGVSARYVQANQSSTANGTAPMLYTSVANFIANKLDNFSFNSAYGTKGMRKMQYFGYLQDEWKLRPNVTLNLGVRYDFLNRFHEVRGRAVPFDIGTCGPAGYCPRGAEFSFPQTHDISPRLGIAWSPRFGKGKTVVRSGFAMYYGDGQLGDTNAPIQNDVPRYSLTIKDTPTLSYPIDPFLVSATPLAQTPRSLARDRRDLNVAQWGLSLQQEFAHLFVGTLSYAGSKGTHLSTRSYANVINAATGARPLPSFGQVDYKATTNNSSFNGLQFSLRRSFEHGLLVSANYMWSHSIDDGSMGGGDSVYPQNVGCRSCERASSNYNVRHTFNINYVYQLPFGPGRPFLSGPGVLGRIVGGWELSGLDSARTGLPVNVTVSRSSAVMPDGNSGNQRPNLVPGVALLPPGGQTVNNWINPAALAVPANNTWGNLGRNIVRARPLWQADAALTKVVSLEKIRLTFRADVFNMFNRAQYGSPTANISAPSTFGRVLAVVNSDATGTGTPRQIQLTLRLGF